MEILPVFFGRQKIFPLLEKTEISTKFREKFRFFHPCMLVTWSHRERGKEEREREREGMKNENKTLF